MLVVVNEYIVLLIYDSHNICESIIRIFILQGKHISEEQSEENKVSFDKDEIYEEPSTANTQENGTSEYEECYVDSERNDHEVIVEYANVPVDNENLYENINEDVKTAETDLEVTYVNDPKLVQGEAKYVNVDSELIEKNVHKQNGEVNNENSEEHYDEIKVVSTTKDDSCVNNVNKIGEDDNKKKGEAEYENVSDQVDYLNLKNVETSSPEYINTKYANIEYEDIIDAEHEIEPVYVNKFDSDEQPTEYNLETFEDMYGPLADIRFSGPGDQLMSTSFSESNDLGDDQDWDSGSDTRSSSSGEFIWKVNSYLFI